MINGASGQLGQEFGRLYGEKAVSLDRAKLDISDKESVDAVINELRPHTIVNCAAYTAVDLAEDERETCYAINSQGVANLALAAKEHGSLLVHFSTDYVFGGSLPADGPRTERSPTSPRGVYATSKLDGEKNATLCPRHLIIRTCGLYGITQQRRNFVETMLRLGRERDEISVVDDQRCNPTSTKVLASAVGDLIELDQSGMFHVVCSEDMSWYEFACEIFRQAKYETRVLPITTEQFGARAPRPAYSVLDTSHCESKIGYSLPTVAESLAEYLDERA